MASEVDFIILKKNELKSTEYKGVEYLSQTQSNGVNYLYFKLRLFDQQNS